MVIAGETRKKEKSRSSSPVAGWQNVNDGEPERNRGRRAEQRHQDALVVDVIDGVVHGVVGHLAVRRPRSAEQQQLVLPLQQQHNAEPRQGAASATADPTQVYFEL